MPAASPPSRARSKPRRRVRKLRLLALLAVLGVLGFGSFMFGLVTALGEELPSLDPARQQKLEVNGYIYANDGRTILAVLRGSQSRVLISKDEMSPYIRHAIVDVEDKRFFEHRGIDVRGIARAVWADLRHKGVVQGGSTITQQFVKNTYVRSERSISRKLKEAALAWQLEQRWSKDRILTAYLNTIYFGNGAYGIQQAAQTYFSHGARKLTLPESALLAGIPEDPARWDPAANPEAARERRRLVLQDMLDQGDIIRADFERANAAPLPKPEDIHLPGTEGPAQYFVNYVKQQLIDRYGSSRVFGGGLRVQTTIDLHLQQLAREAISKTLTDPNGPSAALVAIDPQNGRVLAMIGGNNFRRSQFNLAVQGERQPGSSFKPFVLATALEDGISPSTTLVSAPVEIPLGDRVWSVHNFEDAYLGPIDLTAATIHSDNTVYAQLTRLVGPAAVARTARELGIQSRLNAYYAIGLGGESVNPLEMARAFAAFANGGFRIDGEAFGNRPRVLEWVKDRHDEVIADNRAVPRRFLKPETVALLDSILEGVVREGTGRHAQLPDRPVAGKTGTTENYGDAWFVGFTPQLAAAVWVGYPNRLIPMETEYHGKPVEGGTFPAEIWKAFMEKALAGKPAEAFPAQPSPYAAPRRVVWRDGSLQLDNGYCRNTALVVYFAGDGPSRTADCKPNEVEVPTVVGEPLAAAKARLEGQPLTPVIAYRPAAPAQRLGRVLAQFPEEGRLSSYDKVTLVVAKPLDGVVPKVVGLTLAQAEARLRAAGLEPVVVNGGSGRVVRQSPAARVAAAPGMRVKLFAAAGSGTASRRARTATASRRPG